MTGDINLYCLDLSCNVVMPQLAQYPGGNPKARGRKMMLAWWLKRKRELMNSYSGTTSSFSDSPLTKLPIINGHSGSTHWMSFFWRSNVYVYMSSSDRKTLKTCKFEAPAGRTRLGGIISQRLFREIGFSTLYGMLDVLISKVSA